MFVFGAQKVYCRLYGMTFCAHSYFCINFIVVTEIGENVDGRVIMSQTLVCCTNGEEAESGLSADKSETERETESGKWKSGFFSPPRTWAEENRNT